VHLTSTRYEDCMTTFVSTGTGTVTTVFKRIEDGTLPVPVVSTGYKDASEAEEE
jgi:hypothetical protein